MIERVHIKNFKALRDVTVDLTPIHVLIGPNDSGKSSILQAMFALSESVDDQIKSCFPGLWEGRDLVWNRSKNDIVEVEVSIPIPQRNLWYSVGLEFPERGRKLMVHHETLSFGATNRFSLFHSPHQTFLNLMGSSPQPVAPVNVKYDDLESVRESLRRAHMYRWDSRFIALPSAPDSEWQFRLEPTGFGLPRCLDDILGFDRELFAKMENRFTKCFSEFSSIRLRPQKGFRSAEISNAPLPKLQEQEGKGISFQLSSSGELLPATQVSDGVMLVLAYLAILHLPHPPRLLLIEEPENGIHPQRLELVIEILRDLIKEQQQTQIVMTTHSPYVVDLFEPDEVTLCHKGCDGAVKTRRLSTIPAVQRQLDVFKLGEIWTGEGDDSLANDQASNGETN